MSSPPRVAVLLLTLLLLSSTIGVSAPHPSAGPSSIRNVLSRRKLVLDEPSATASASASASSSATSSSSSSSSSTASSSATSSSSASPSSTASSSASSSSTASPSESASATTSATGTATSSSTSSPSSTATGTCTRASDTATASRTAGASLSSTRSAVPTRTASSTSSASASATATATATSSYTPLPSMGDAGKPVLAAAFLGASAPFDPPLFSFMAVALRESLAAAAGVSASSVFISAIGVTTTAGGDFIWSRQLYTWPGNGGWVNEGRGLCARGMRQYDQEAAGPNASPLPAQANATGVTADLLSILVIVCVGEAASSEPTPTSSSALLVQQLRRRLQATSPPTAAGSALLSRISVPLNSPSTLSTLSDYVFSYVATEAARASPPLPLPQGYVTLGLSLLATPELQLINGSLPTPSPYIAPAPAGNTNESILPVDSPGFAVAMTALVIVVLGVCFGFPYIFRRIRTKREAEAIASINASWIAGKGKKESKPGQEGDKKKDANKPAGKLVFDFGGGGAPAAPVEEEGEEEREGEKGTDDQPPEDDAEDDDIDDDDIDFDENEGSGIGLGFGEVELVRLPPVAEEREVDDDDDEDDEEEDQKKKKKEEAGQGGDVSSLSASATAPPSPPRVASWHLDAPIQPVAPGEQPKEAEVVALPDQEEKKAAARGGTGGDGEGGEQQYQSRQRTRTRSSDKSAAPAPASPALAALRTPRGLEAVSAFAPAGMQGERVEGNGSASASRLHTGEAVESVAEGTPPARTTDEFEFGMEESGPVQFGAGDEVKVEDVEEGVTEVRRGKGEKRGTEGEQAVRKAQAHIQAWI